MAIREHRRPAVLAAWLDCVWERGAGHAGDRILPDGCIDVVFSPDRGLRLVGANTVAFVSDVEPGEPVVGARFLPGAAPALLGVAAEPVLDQRPPLSELLGDEGHRLQALLYESPDRVAVLRAWLIDQARQARAPDPLVAAAVVGLVGSDRRLGPLADSLGVSERALRRRVTAAVGYGPKRLARVLRLRRALALAAAGSALADVAYEAGYADQAHFSHDCLELAGVAPGRFLQDAAARS
jgi:AraC-like DNA-binding protein